MRVGIILEQPIEVGGGFQQSLNEVLWFNAWAASAGVDATVLTPHAENVTILSEFGVKAERLKIGNIDHLILILKYFAAFDLLQYALRIRAPFEKRLMSAGIDVVYFTTPSKWHLLLYKLPFIITIFDGCHRDAPEFGEVREFGEFERREILFRSACTKAALVVANSQQLIDALCRRYAMESDRAVCIPFAPSTYVKNSSSDDKSKDEVVLQKYHLQPGYLFYPAQFWPHKNHATLLAALDILRGRGQRINLVLCGSDRGSRRRIEGLIAKYHADSQVTILGFVDSSELGALYRGSAALVMPSYFGPTNLPPLEAWAVGTPVVYPQAFKDQVEDAAVLFDYDDPQSLADAISSISSPQLCARLREAGEKRLQHFVKQTDEGHQEFARHIKRLQHRLMLYSPDA